MQEANSLISSLVALPALERQAILAQLSDGEATELIHDWRAWARPNQIAPPGKWRAWLVLAGRGFGKTRTGAEWVREQVQRGKKRIALVAETAADARDVIVEGESGILACYPDNDKPHYEPSKRRISWSNGAIATTYSGDEPDQLRGPQSDAAWADEVAKWQYAQEAWDNLEFGLRLGDDPQVVVTTTPRPLKIIRDLLKDPQTVVTRGSTYENFQNLAPSFIERVVQRYEGTRLGRQELHAEVLDDVPGALWVRSRIDELRVREEIDQQRIVVAIDPAVTSGEDSDETGIVVAGKGVDGHGYALADLSCRLSPDGWARRAIQAFRHYGADRIVAEVNNGGDMVEQTLRTIDKSIPFRAVRATRGKVVRAEPISARYEQGTMHHVGPFDALEDQMCSMTPDGYLGTGSPDRADALVWAFTELFGTPELRFRTLG